MVLVSAGVSTKPFRQQALAGTFPRGESRPETEATFALASWVQALHVNTPDETMTCTSLLFTERSLVKCSV